MIDAQTVAQVESINTDINERLDDTKIWIQHGEGGSTLENEYDLQQYDEGDRNIDPTSEGYGAANSATPLANAEDLNDNSGLQWSTLVLRHYTYLNTVASTTFSI